jgi:pimeloyl-ACP methyl ester carboxylesterase
VRKDSHRWVIREQPLGGIAALNTASELCVRAKPEIPPRGMVLVQSEYPMMKSEVTGQGESIVLVPGGLTGWLSWEPHAKRLSEKYRVVRVQLMAVDMGLRNEPLPADYSVNYETEALMRAVDQVGVEKAHFAAWSFGAEVTLNFALNNPERVRTLTLIEPPAIWVIRSRGPLSEEQLEDQKKIQTLGPLDVNEDQLVWFTHFAGFVPQKVDPRTLPQWPVWSKHRQSLRTGDVVYRHVDDIERVRSFKKPTLLFKGEGSSPWLHDIMDILADEFPSAQAETLPGGHAPHIVSMEAFMNIFNRFLASNEV